jgi:hypothetical protein
MKFIPVLDVHIKLKYSQHPKSGPSGFQMVIFQTQFVSSFQMVKSAILFRKPDDLSGFQMAGNFVTT